MHGLLSSRAQWIPNIGALAPEVTPVVFELWGHGRSPAPKSDAWYSVDAYLNEFARVRCDLGAEKVLMCGQSFGAGLTLHYSIRYPGRVSTQIVLNSVAALSFPGEGMSTEQLNVLAAGIDERGTRALQSLPFHPSNAKRLPRELRVALVDAANNTSPAAVAKAVRVTFLQILVAEKLHCIASPTLLVNGVREGRFQPFRARAAEKIRHLHILDLQAGHAPNLESPEAFNKAVLDFLSEIRTEYKAGG